MNMKVPAGLAVLALLAVCLLSALAAKPPAVCEFRATNSYLRTFWNPTCFPLTTFPCSYKLAHFQCGADAPSTTVTVNNDVDDKGNTRVSSFTITITADDNDVTHTFSRSNYDLYSASKEWDRLWERKGSAREGEAEGGYDRANKMAYYISGGLNVTFRVKEDILRVECTARPFTSLEGFGQTFCGDPDSRYEDENALYKEIPADRYFGEPHAYGLWADFVAFSKQSIKQKDPLCKDASKLVSKEGSGRGQTLYKCHMFYTQRYDRQYRQCMDKNDIDSFNAYVTCLSVLTGKGPATDDQCKTLRDVYTQCGDVKTAPLKVTTLLEAGQCRYKVTTRAPRTDQDSADSGGSMDSDTRDSGQTYRDSW